MNTTNRYSACDKALDALLQSNLMAMNNGYLWIATKEGKHYV